MWLTSAIHEILYGVFECICLRQKREINGFVFRAETKRLRKSNTISGNGYSIDMIKFSAVQSAVIRITKLKTNATLENQLTRKLPLLGWEFLFVRTPKKSIARRQVSQALFAFHFF